MKKGDYIGAVKQSVHKLRRNPDRKKDIEVLQKAYPLAVKQLNDQIKYLHTEGRPDRWDKVYQLYSQLKELQDLVESVTPLNYNGRRIVFEHKDYDRKIVEAKNKAALYYYTHAKKLMQQNNKQAYRQAFYELKKAKEYNPSYYDADSLMQVCYDRGQTNVILIVQNSTMYKLSDDFLINLIDFPVAQLNSQWIKYYNRDVRKGNYDISVYVVLKIISVSPDNLDQKTQVYKKQVQDGYEYKLDSQGHIMTDSAGNPIKVPKYKTISCQLKEFRQFKIAHIEGIIDYVDNSNSQSLLQLPIAADHTFENYYYVANGDLNALPNDKRKLLNSKPIPYPNDLDMIYAANETLRNVIFSALMDNRDFLEDNF